jgi:hypothetical protein
MSINRAQDDLIIIIVQMSNLHRRVFSSGKKDQLRPLIEDRTISFCTQQQMLLTQEYITVTVIPCGREDGKNSEEEIPYEIKIRKKGKHIRHLYLNNHKF